MDAELCLAYALAYATLTVLMVRGSIFERLKKFILRYSYGPTELVMAELLYCSQCLGFWVGMGGSFHLPVRMDVLWHLLFAAMVSTFAILLDRIIYGKPDRSD